MTSIHSFIQKCLCITALVALAAIPAAAQTAANGSITGTVTDSTGAAIASATVVIKNTDTGAVHNLTTSGDGSFFVPFLQSGHYEVIAGATNFTKVDHKGLTLTVGQTLTINSALPAAGTTTEIIVTSEAPLIDTQKVEASQTITQEYISNLPVNSRRWDSFVLLTANVAPDGNSGLVSFHGINGLYNSNLVDGVSNQQALFAEARGRATIAPYVYPPDSIKEFQSSNSGYSAELGNAAGGVTNAITKSGSNALHADLFYSLRYPALNAVDPYSKWTVRFVPGTNPALATPTIHQQQQFGGSVGGAIIKDKLFYFFTYDGFRRAGPALYTSSALGTVNQTAYETPVSSGGQCPNTVSTAVCTNAVNYLLGQEGNFSRNIKQDLFFPKLDWQPTEKDHLSLSYLWGDYKQPNAYVATPVINNSGVSTNATYYVHSRFLIGSWDRVINSTTANSFKWQWSRDLETTNANGPGPSVTVSGIATYGEATGVPRIAEPDEHRLQFVDVLSQTRGKHTMKVGADLNFIHEIMIQLFQGDGVYTYNSTGTTQAFTNWVTDATGGGQHYTGFAQTVDPITGVGKDDFWGQNFAFFAEDSWKAKPKLTVTVGVRYDLQLVPQPTVPFNTSPNGNPSPLGIAYTQHIPINHHMLAPRLGFAWNPFPKTVIRGGYGLFFANIPNSTFYNVRVENGKYQGQYNLNPSTTSTNVPSGYPTGAPSNTNVLFVPPGPPLAAPFAGAVTPTAIGLPACAPGSLTCAAISFHGMDPHFTNPYTHSFDLAVEQQLTSTTSLTVAYTGTRGMRLPYAPDRNITPWTGATRTYDVTNAAGVTLRQVTVPFYPSASCTAGVGTCTPLPSPVDGNVSVVTSNLNTWYNALSFSVKQKMKWGFQGLANYTWAHTQDGGQIAGSGGTFYGTDVILDPYNRKNAYPGTSGINMSREASNSDIDMRTRFVMSLVYTSKYSLGNRWVGEAANGWTVAGTYTAQDGFPITAFTSNNPSNCTAVGVSGANTVGCTNTALSPRDGGATGGGDNTSNAPAIVVSRDPFDKRNGFKGPGIHNLDMRISRDFDISHGMHFEVMMDAFNFINHRNGLGVATTAYTYVNPSTPTNPLTTPTGAQAACPVASHSNTCIIPNTSNAATTTPFGTINNTSSTLYGPRQLQFSAKLSF
jgi:hypothetical protein